MEKMISLNDEQVKRIDIIDNFFVQEQNRLRSAMAQAEQQYSNASDSFVPRAMGRIFIGEKSEPVIVFQDFKSERFSEKHSIVANVRSEDLDYEGEETIELCAATKEFLHDWNWDSENPVPELQKETVRIEVSVSFTSCQPPSLKDFTFADIPCLTDSEIEKLLSKIDTLDLITALKFAGENVQNKFFFNMSKRAAQMLKEDMEYHDELTLENSIEAQKKILGIVRDLKK